MIAATGVSRTVVREAVAALQGRPAGGDPPGRRRLCRRSGAAAVPGRFRRTFAAARGAQRHGTAHRRRNRGRRALPPNAAVAGAGEENRRSLCRDQRRYRPRRSRGRPGLRLPLRNRRCDRQSAVPAFPRISRPLHHSAAHGVGPLGTAHQSESSSTSSSRSTSRSCTRSGQRAVDAGARRHAAASH